MTGAAKDLGNPVEAKLLAGHQAGVDVPPIVTNCAPVIIKKDLYPSSEWIITSYTQCTICQNFERKGLDINWFMIWLKCPSVIQLLDLLKKSL